MPHAPTREALRAAVETAFPLVVGPASITATDVHLRDDGALAATFLALGGACETECTFCVVPAGRTADPRALAWWSAAQGSIRAWLAAGSEDPVFVFELLFPEALDDLSLQTSDDFAAALADPRRLAAWREQRLRAEVLPYLERMGFADRIDEFLALPRPAIHLEHATRVDPLDRDDDEPPPVGGTRLGGEPDLPPDLPWPALDGVPLTFAAQLDLGDLQRFASARELPREGLLSFFYEPLPDFRDDRIVDHRSRVLHFPTLAGLERRRTPPGGDPRPEYTVTPADAGELMPPLDSPFYAALLPEERVAGFHRRLREGTDPLDDPLAELPALLGEHGEWLCYQDPPQHRVLGQCLAHQGDVYLEAEATAAGLPWTYPDMDSPAGLRLSRAACRWRLLLQLSADGEDELLFNQDSGFVYFMIPADALAGHQWDRVQCLIQCS